MYFVRLVCFLLLLASLCLATDISGSPCITPSASLRTYLTPSQSFPNGCDTGILNFKFLEFGLLTPLANGGYSFNSEGGVITPDNLLVVPQVNGTTATLNFESTAFQTNFPATQIYYIAYTIDPAPILIGEEIGLDFGPSAFSVARAPAFQAAAAPDVQVTQYVCPDTLFARTTTSPSLSSNQCATGPGTRTSNPFVLTASLQKPADSVLFGQAVPFVSNHLYIQVTGDLTGSGFLGVGITPLVTAVPEPLTAGLAATGFGLLAVIRKRLHRG